VPSSGGLMRVIAGLAAFGMFGLSVGRPELQLRGAEIGGGPRPTGFFGFNMPA